MRNCCHLGLSDKDIPNRDLACSSFFILLCFFKRFVYSVFKEFQQSLSNGVQISTEFHQLHVETVERENREGFFLRLRRDLSLIEETGSNRRDCLLTGI